MFKVVFGLIVVLLVSASAIDFVMEYEFYC